MASIEPAWYRNLGREIAANLLGDTAAQVLTLSLWYWHVRSGWLLVAWTIRWVLMAGLVVAEWLRRRRRRDQAVLAILAAHAFGIVATVPILPEVLPLAVFVLVSDLLLVVRYERDRSFRLWVVLAALVAAWVGLAGQQHGARLGQRTPRALYFAFLMGGPAVSGAIEGSNMAASRRQLVLDTNELGRSRRRLALAGLEQRKAFARELQIGPLASLHRLAVRVEQLQALHHTSDPTLPEATGLALQDAQGVAARLRDLSHGIFPDALRQHGLGDALAVLAQRISVPIELADPIPVLDEATATTAYLCCATAAMRAGQLGSFRVSLRADHRATWLRIDLVVPDGANPAERDRDRPDDLLDALRDRLRAADGAIRIVEAPRCTIVEVHLPTPVDRDVTSFVGDSAVHQPARLATSLRALALRAVTTYGIVLMIALFAPALLAAAVLLSTVPVLAILPYVQARTVTVAIAVQTLAGGVIAAYGGYLLIYQSIPTRNWSAPGYLVAAPLAAALIVVGIGRLLRVAHAQLVDQAHELRRSEARLVASSDEERRRIERDLHDGGQQQCVALAIQLKASIRVLDQPARFLSLLDDVKELIVATSADLDRLVSGSAPVRPDTTLGDALREALSGTQREVLLDDRLSVDADNETTTAAYFCCLESVQNALKHAGDDATITVTLHGTDGQLVFEVVDDGIGFDPATVRAGHGIRSLSERLEAFGGELRLVSTPGIGTRVTGVLPVTGTPLSGEVRR